MEDSSSPLNIVDTGVNIICGPDIQISTSKFHAINRSRKDRITTGITRWKPEACGNHRIHICDIIPCVEGYITTAQRAHTFEEITEINPPCGRGTISNL